MLKSTFTLSPTPSLQKLIIHRHSGGSDDSGIFGNVLGFLQQNKHSVGNQGVDEQGAVQAHQQYFGGGGGGSGQQADSSSMGSAAAMQALKVI